MIRRTDPVIPDVADTDHHPGRIGVRTICDSHKMS